jgi:hypothetical protein
MDVDGNMVVAGEEKRVAIFFENLRHHPSVHDRRLGALSAVAWLLCGCRGGGFACRGPLPNTAQEPRATSCGIMRIGE